MSQNFKAIFFDWDNTLVDTWPVLMLASNLTLAHYGFSQITLEEIKVRAQISSRESFPKIYGDNWQEAHRFFYQAIQDNKNTIKLYDGVLELLGEIKRRGYITAIISNKKNTLVREETNQFGVAVDLVLGSGDCAHDKPNPELGEMALGHFGLSAAEVIYIGDSLTDWQFAEAVGMAAIAIGDDPYDGRILGRFASVGEAVSSIF